AIQKCKPLRRDRRTSIVGHRQPASHNLWPALGERTIQLQGAVGQMDAVCLRREVIHMSCQLQYLQNVGDLPGDVVHSAALQFLINLSTQRKNIRHSAVRREESAVGKDDFAMAQKLITEQCLVDIGAVKPDGAISKFPVLHGFSPPFSAAPSVLPVSQSCRPDGAYPPFLHGFPALQRPEYPPDTRYGQASGKPPQSDRLRLLPVLLVHTAPSSSPEGADNRTIPADSAAPLVGTPLPAGISVLIAPPQRAACPGQCRSRKPASVLPRSCSGQTALQRSRSHRR